MSANHLVTRRTGFFIVALHSNLRDLQNHKKSAPIRSALLKLKPQITKASLGGMTLFELVNLFIHFILGVTHRLTHFPALLIGALARFIFLRIAYLFGGVFCVSPSFLSRTFGLVNDALIGELFTANSFPDSLLNFPDSLIELTFNLVFIHEFRSFKVRDTSFTTLKFPSLLMFSL